MTYTKTSFLEFLSTVDGFDQLSREALVVISQQLQPWRYRLGKKIIGKEKLPEQITIIYEGKARLLAYDPRTQKPITLKLLQPGAILGEISVLRDVACETAIASTEVTCLTFPTVEYLRLLAMYPAFAEIRQNCCHLLEIFDVVGMQSQVQALGGVNLKELAQKALAEARVHYLQPGKNSVNQLDRESIWFVSGGGTVKNYPLGSRLEFNSAPEIIEVVGTSPARLIGLRTLDLMILDNLKDTNAEILDNETKLKFPMHLTKSLHHQKLIVLKINKKIKNTRIFMVTDN